MSVILLIRHAEKPDAYNLGIDSTGANDPESLSVRGWQRAGALLGLFGSTPLPRPARIYASAPLRLRKLPGKIGARSKRSAQTVSVLAAKRGLDVNIAFTRGQEQIFGAELTRFDEGTTLVCWPREGLPLIAAAILGKPDGIPAIWPSDCFDIVWRLVRETPAAAWTFDQVCQRLLPGDRMLPIS